MAAAYGIRSIAFMTDERLAFRHAEGVLGLSVETTPRLYGYLHFKKLLVDSDHRLVITEHEKFEKRPLSRFLQEAYEEAMRCTLMVAPPPPSASAPSDDSDEEQA
jgi:hypothetical protein